MTATKTSHKDMATTFLRLAGTGKVHEAYERYAGSGFRHHNPYFKGDSHSLMVAMDENATKFPQKVLEVKHALEDGNYVAVHSRVLHEPNGKEVAVFHLFRFEGDQLVELWDVGQEAPDKSPNENGMF